MARIGFENSHLTGILLLADRIHSQHARFGTQRDFAYFGCVFHILVEILRINLDFRQPHDTVSTHRLFGTHTRPLIQIQAFADNLSRGKVGIGRKFKQYGFQLRIVKFPVIIKHFRSSVCIDYRTNEIVETFSFIDVYHLTLHGEG